jgi:hypothetical protein
MKPNNTRVSSPSPFRGKKDLKRKAIKIGIIAIQLQNSKRKSMTEEGNNFSCGKCFAAHTFSGSFFLKHKAKSVARYTQD